MKHMHSRAALLAARYGLTLKDTGHHDVPYLYEHPTHFQSHRISYNQADQLDRMPPELVPMALPSMHNNAARKILLAKLGAT